LGLEGLGGPLLQRLRRLHVVMAINEKRRRARRPAPLPEDDRVSLSRPHFSRFEPGLEHLIGEPVSRSANVCLVLRLGADARDTEERHQFLEVSVPVSAQVIEYVAHYREYWNARVAAAAGGLKPGPAVLRRALWIRRPRGVVSRSCSCM